MRHGWLLFMYVFAAIIIIGIALFSSLIRLDVSKIMWLAGAFILFAGTYFVAHATNMYIWHMNIARERASTGI